MFTRTGKNTITTTTAAFDCQSKPNHMTRMGARPTMGRAATKLPMGKSPRCRKGLLSMAMAVRNAAPQPIAKPGSAPFRKVWAKSAQRVGSSARSFAPIALGAGRMTGETA